MAQSVETKVVVFSVRRIASGSRSGNPRFEFNTDHGIYKTKPDTGAAFGLENDFELGEILDRKATLITTPSGLVYDWKL